jgi:hypothetical protein
LAVARREQGVVLEVVGEGEPGGGTHVGDLQVAQDQPQVFDGADAPVMP